MNSIWCITTCGITLFCVYFHMQRYAFLHVFPHMEIHITMCKSSFGIYTLLLAFPHVKIHISVCFSPCACISACGNTHNTV